MSTDLAYLLFGVALLIAVVLPIALRHVPPSAPVVLLGVGCVIGLLPLAGKKQFSPIEHASVTEHLAELTVIASLMGVGLALDRPLSLRRLGTWHGWRITWRLLGVTMPLCILAVGLLGWWWLGLTLPAALLLAAVLAPTDPVLASDVQVEGPGQPSEGAADIDETDEVRFALTSEAGLNDSLAFPFVYLAILLATPAPFAEVMGQWFGFYVLGKIAIGASVGALIGWLLGKFAFRSTVQKLQVAEQGEPLLAVAVLLLSYGVAEVAQGYGFLAVFVAAVSLRAIERDHEYHRQMHGMMERLEQLLTLTMLLLLGIALTNGLLKSLTLAGVGIGLSLVFFIRPVFGWLALLGTTNGEPKVDRGERMAIGFFGVRGIGSVYYLAYAAGKAKFDEMETLWSTVLFTIALSILVHGISASPVMNRLGFSASNRSSG